LQFRAHNRSLAVRVLIILLAPVLFAGITFAQTPVAVRRNPVLPSAPRPQPAATGVISGTVLDTNHDVVQSAHLILRMGSETRIANSGSDGQFEFQNLAPGQYKLTVTAQDMSTFISDVIPLAANGSVILPSVVLSVTASTSVTVTGNKEQLSIEQVQIAENQRVLAVFPNFYTSFDWNAPPMMAKQKFHLAMRSLFDPVSFLTVAGVAGAEQYENIFPAYGSGLAGYGKRYAAAFANHASSDFFGRAVYPAIFHEDPRYFYRGTGSISSRGFYAISAAFVARGDNGRWRPNYAGLLGNFTSGAISNLYYPSGDRGASLVLDNGLADTAANVFSNLIREFVLRGITSHVPQGANGKP
jgi:hypothetical protein